MDSPVCVREARAVGAHSELPEELPEPFLDLGLLQSAFIAAVSLSTSEVVAVVNSRVVKARHPEAGRWTTVVTMCCIY